ncbi:hypothetical protein HNO88_003701 [Novosphingobium chloroacetimidivorans]|uniref:Toprim domain-containing protein n=1 Tax=Novosphingobium chloroacetimidivorans TaxID=1428314 RepID=A0A7W7KE17_9SPHN|nr:toprim domain-containing protein [Novosphingobium chloroacetimidivorans]MBB4860358.1 hypothetical protein [Novosphingobium chloroacetimidivorans]
MRYDLGDTFAFYAGVRNFTNQGPDIGFETIVPISPFGRFFYAGAESFEDAACYTRVKGVPAWAALRNARLHLIDTPKHVRTIVIAQDNDSEGDVRVGRAVEVYREQGFKVGRHSPHSHEDWGAIPMEV